MSNLDHAAVLAGLAAIAAEVERLAGLIADESIDGPVATSVDTFDAEDLVDSAVADLIISRFIADGWLGRCMTPAYRSAAWNSVEIHRLTYFDRGLITVDPIDVVIVPERIRVVVPFHPHASGDDASLKRSRNRRFGDLCGMSTVEQRSSKIDQFSRVHGTTSARLNFRQAKHLQAAFGSVTVGYSLSHAGGNRKDTATRGRTPLGFAVWLNRKKNSFRGAL